MNLQKLGICDVCNQHDGKYRCPQCQSISCSLECCKRHKTESECSGQKEKVPYLPLAEMNGRSLANDIKFLTNLSNKIDLSKREPLLHPFQDRNTNDRFRSLCSAAKYKKIRLFLQPIGMAKHQNNQTFVKKANHTPPPHHAKQSQHKNANNQVSKTIYWTIAVQFASHQLLLHALNENDSLLSILRNLKQEKFQTLSTKRTPSTVNEEEKKIGYKHEVLQEYSKYLNDINLIRLPKAKRRKQTNHRQHVEDSSKIARSVINEVVLPAVWRKSCVEIDDKEKLNVVLKIPNHFMYVRVDPSHSLLSILKQKVINEYPEFVVLLPHEMQTGDYVVVDCLEHPQFQNVIKHNTRIETQRNKLREQMQHQLDEKKLFHTNQHHHRHHSQHHGSRPRNHQYNHHRTEIQRVNRTPNKHRNVVPSTLKAQDLFNGNIVGGDKRTFGEMNSKNGGVETDSRPTKKAKTTYNNPFATPLQGASASQPQPQAPGNTSNNHTNWYLYM